jgi:hypothetical protein
MGEKTFGKGVVQYFFPMGDGSGLKLTVAKYLTPKMYDISRNGGLSPDFACKDYPHGEPTRLHRSTCLTACHAAHPLVSDQQHALIAVPELGHPSVQARSGQVRSGHCLCRLATNLRGTCLMQAWFAQLVLMCCCVCFAAGVFTPGTADRCVTSALDYILTVPQPDPLSFSPLLADVGTKQE